ADVKEIQLCTAILERAERSKSEAVANVSHELRTPIIGMMGMIEELLESPLEEWQRADLVDARACAGETVELINRVLDLAKLQAGRLQLETLPCCLRRIVREATTFAPGKTLPVTFHVDDSVPETLYGDPTRILQVMAELVASAMNNTATGHITIRVSCIPPPHAASTPPPPAAASGTTQASSEPAPAASAWHQLAGCVRRFPPPTRLVCLPQHRPASQGGPQGGGGLLEEEVREWVEGACAVREVGEWMVVVACEDTGGGIPPEELWGLLDPHGMHGSGQHKVMERIRSLGRAESWKGLGRADSWKGLGRTDSRRQRERSAWDPLQRDRKAAAGPRWTPYPVRFLLSTSLVSFLLSTSLVSFLLSTSLVSFLLSTSLVTSLAHCSRDAGAMAVLSDTSTGTTILLALPMGGGEDTGSSTGDEERSREECGESEGASEERVEQGSGSQECMKGPASGASAQPAAPQQRQAAGARALVHAHTFPQMEVEQVGAGVDGAREAERVVRAVVAGRRVAVVDDNAVNRMVARRTLQGYGAHVLLLPSGEEVIKTLSSDHLSSPQETLFSATPSPPIHLLLLDLHMPPGIDGFETARRVRAMENAQQMKSETSATEICEAADTSVDDASKQRLCIIALTADLDVGIKRACLEAGMDGALSRGLSHRCRSKSSAVAARMRSSLARFSPSRVPPGVARALLGAAWVAGWAGLCAWVVWFAHSQAANPRQEAMRAWCRTRVRYLQQDIRSSIDRAQSPSFDKFGFVSGDSPTSHPPNFSLSQDLPTSPDLSRPRTRSASDSVELLAFQPLGLRVTISMGESIGLVGAFGRFGPRSSSNLSYWGLAGCVNNNSMLAYNLQADAVANYSTGTIIMFVSDQDRPLVESIIGHPIRSVLGLPAPRKDLYGVNVYGSINPDFPIQPFTDFLPLLTPDLRTNLLKGQPIAGAPLSAGPGYVATGACAPLSPMPYF
ncbi:unnamed protein product, partial [Closterium sp. Yama58-4]